MGVAKRLSMRQCESNVSRETAAGKYGAHCNSSYPVGLPPEETFDVTFQIALRISMRQNMRDCCMKTTAEYGFFQMATCYKPDLILLI